ncbi:MAG: ATP-binding protein [Arcobacteraceae bacterium]
MMILDTLSKILIIDVLRSNKFTIQDSFDNNLIYQLFQASDTENGIKLAMKELPHAIILNTMVLQKDLHETIKILRNTKTTQHIPIIIIQAKENKDVHREQLDLSMADFILHPFEKSILQTKVNAHIYLYKMHLRNIKELQQENQKLKEELDQNLQKRFEDIKLNSLGKVATAITHELNTPITYMKSNIEIMAHDIASLQANEKVKKELTITYEILNNGLKQLQNIINNTKQIAKKGKNSYLKENLYTTIIFSTRIIYNRSKYLMPIYINGVLFDLDLDENFESFHLHMIKERLEQVWIIILNNACDEFEHSTKKQTDRKVLIDITQHKDRLKIIFKDNANHGIPTDIMMNIFDPFVSTKIDKGMGVGLNIAKDIVEEHMGTIKAYNQDEFAIFEIVFLETKEKEKVLAKYHRY